MASHLTPALRCRFRHTAICVFEKNYRLQDIQLSKNLGTNDVSNYGRLNSRTDSNHVARLANRATARPSVSVVENTGLEPVTSWLQTRRSPS